MLPCHMMRTSSLMHCYYLLLHCHYYLHHHQHRYRDNYRKRKSNTSCNMSNHLLRRCISHDRMKQATLPHLKDTVTHEDCQHTRSHLHIFCQMSQKAIISAVNRINKSVNISQKSFVTTMQTMQM